jgi:hypothetical protein
MGLAVNSLSCCGTIEVWTIQAVKARCIVLFSGTLVRSRRMDEVKLEPDSDNDIEPVSVLCETELVNIQEDSPSANNSGHSGVSDEVQQFCNNVI